MKCVVALSSDFCSMNIVDLIMQPEGDARSWKTIWLSNYKSVKILLQPPRENKIENNVAKYDILYNFRFV